jgi:hypothetical protein
MWEKIKTFLKKYWDKLVAYLNTLAWFKKTIKIIKEWGLPIINLFVVCVGFASARSEFAIAVMGFWVFALLAYYIFWKLLGASELFKKDENT